MTRGRRPQRTTAVRRHSRYDTPSWDGLPPAGPPSARSLSDRSLRPLVGCLGALRAARSLRQLAARDRAVAGRTSDVSRRDQPAGRGLRGTSRQQRVSQPSAEAATVRYRRCGLRRVADVPARQRRRALRTRPHRCGHGQDPGETTLQRVCASGAGSGRLALGCRLDRFGVGQRDAAEAESGYARGDQALAHRDRGRVGLGRAGARCGAWRALDCRREPPRTGVAAERQNDRNCRPARSG